MAISKKGKRKLIVKDREYYWYMKLTDDWMYSYNTPQLHVLSADKKFLISYQPGQQNEIPFLIIKGREFKGLKELGGSWVRVKTPKWNDEQVPPRFVAELIEWCYNGGKEIVLVDYLGKIIKQKNT